MPESSNSTTLKKLQSGHSEKIYLNLVVYYNDKIAYI